MAEVTINDVVIWIEDGEGMADTSYCHDHPELVWQAIFLILQRDPPDEEKGDLVAGPLEELLYFHGVDFIERVEVAARTNAKFNYVLGGVWQAEMPPEIWERVQKARKEVW